MTGEGRVTDDLVVTAHDGLELAVRDHGGEGPDVVFLHGVQRTLEDWRPLLRRLSGVRGVTMDLRFHGRSGVPDDATWDDFVRDIDAVVDRLGLSDPFVVGHSFGGLLALGYAVGHPTCPGVMDIDGFDFRQREFLDELEPSVVDAFLEDFCANVSIVTAGAGDDSWHAEQQDSIGHVNEMWRIPDEVASATFERMFVRTATAGSGARRTRTASSTSWTVMPICSRCCGRSPHPLCTSPAGQRATRASSRRRAPDSNDTWEPSPPTIRISVSRRSSPRTA